jgi:urease subunit gamma/beta
VDDVENDATAKGAREIVTHMKLTPREIDKLILHGAGFLAQKRYARGVLLNYPESIALLSAQLLEFIRDGDSVAELMDKGKKILGLNECMSGVAEMIPEVQVEGTFPDGTKLVTVHDPVCRERGVPELALYGSGLSRIENGLRVVEGTTPGKVVPKDGSIKINVDRERVTLLVTNGGDRPVQVGSHYPFFEVNPELSFDRSRAFGFRLNIASGTAVRFEPGEAKEVELVAVSGNRIVRGGNGLIDGPVSADRIEEIVEKAVASGYRHTPSPE